MLLINLYGWTTIIIWVLHSSTNILMFSKQSLIVDTPHPLPENWRKPTKIIPSQILSVYTDRKHPSVIRSVYTDGVSPSVYTDRITDVLYSFFWKVATVWWRGFFQTILPTGWPRDSNRDLRTVTWHYHRRTILTNTFCWGFHR